MMGEDMLGKLTKVPKVLAELTKFQSVLQSGETSSVPKHMEVEAGIRALHTNARNEEFNEE